MGCASMAFSCLFTIVGMVIVFYNGIQIDRIEIGLFWASLIGLIGCAIIQMIGRATTTAMKVICDNA